MMARCEFPTGDIVSDAVFTGMAHSIQEWVAAGNDPALWIATADPESAYFWVAECVQANYLEAFVDAQGWPQPGPGAAHDAYSPLGALMPSNESALFMAGAALIVVFLMMRDR
jgi:hypothetical protein